MNKYIYSNRNDDYIYEIEDILQNGKKEILDFFDIKDNKSYEFNVYVFNTLDEMYEVLKKKNIITNELSYYSNNSFYFFEPDEWYKETYKKNIFNEEIKCIENSLYDNHPKWLIEGIAMYMNNELDIETIINNKTVNAYKRPYSSYIIVNYLIEKYTKSLFIKLISLKQYICFIENNNILEEAINYYYEKYNKKIKIKH